MNEIYQKVGELESGVDIGVWGGIKVRVANILIFNG